MFAHTLARDMGRVDVDAMMEEMTLPQFARWMVYYGKGEQLLPWAFLAAAVGNMLGSKKQLRPSDFLPKKRQSPESQKAVFTAFIQAHNASVKKGGKS